MNQAVLNQVAITLLLLLLLPGGGCRQTPDLQPDPEAIEKANFFYSRPRDRVEGGGEMAGDGQPGSGFPIYDSYLINPHDLIEISVLGESDLSLSVRVSDKGTISFPLLGEINAAGYTPVQFERRLEELLEKDYLVSPSVNITIREYGTISVLGQVKKPGSFEIKGRLTITQAIALAGGLTSTASPNGTRIIRRLNEREEIIPIRLNDIFRGGDLSSDIRLRPGDLIVVPESFF